MKILYVCHRFPYPPQRGGKIRPFNVIKHLSEKHEVIVASLVRSRDEARLSMGLRNYCSDFIMEIVNIPTVMINVLKRLTTRTPYSMAYFYSSNLKKRIQREVARTNFDLIMVHCSSVAQYVEDVVNVPKILDFGDMDSQKWLIYSKVRRFPHKLLFAVEGNRLQRAEADLARKFTYCTCTTVEEMKTLESYNIRVKTGWFPNGVDTEYFKPADEPYERDSICFLGRMDYYPNQESILYFCKHVFPLIRAERPNAKLLIIGADPPHTIRELERTPGVSVTGSVPDVRPYVQRCAVNVAPLNIARGTQNKILEALAMGVPTVASKVAAGGVDCIPGEHFITESSTEGYVDAVVRLLSDHKERQKFSEAGRARMLSHHNWQHSMKQLDQIVDDCLENAHQ